MRLDFVISPLAARQEVYIRRGPTQSTFLAPPASRPTRLFCCGSACSSRPFRDQNRSAVSAGRLAPFTALRKSLPSPSTNSIHALAARLRHHAPPLTHPRTDLQTNQPVPLRFDGSHAPATPLRGPRTDFTAPGMARRGLRRSGGRPAGLVSFCRNASIVWFCASWLACSATSWPSSMPA